MDLDEAATAFRHLAEVVQALRTPQTGCPWDLEQDHRTLRPYLVEEAYEVLDAIDRDDDRALCEELGDLLLQVVLHAQLAADRAAFSITDVVRGITEKMVRRHPHVFAAQPVSGSAEVVRNWEQIKAAETQAKGGDASPSASLGRLPKGLPALLRAQRLGEKAARAGVEESTPVDRAREAFGKLTTHLQGNERGAAEERPSGEVHARTGEELGDLLFTLAQLARRLGLSAEETLQASNQRFVERFSPAPAEQRPESDGEVPPIGG